MLSELSIITNCDPAAPGSRKTIPLPEDRKIGENLKLLYGYRCQLCGKLIGEEFGAPVAEAHHIDYYVKSLNNDANNQMVVCPNHHSIIHEADPKFDRKKMMYLYPNGAEQRVVLNEHLRCQRK